MIHCAVSPGCPPRQINNLEDVSLTVFVFSCEKEQHFSKSVEGKLPLDLRQHVWWQTWWATTRCNGSQHAVWSFQAICGVTEWLTDNANKTQAHVYTPSRPRPLSVLDISIHDHHWPEMFDGGRGGRPCQSAEFEGILCKMSYHH